MRKSLYILIVSCFALVSCSSNQYRIDGDLQGVSSKYAYIFRVGRNSSIDTIAKSRIEGGKYSFNGIVENEEIVYLAFEGQKRAAGIFFLEAGNIKLKASIIGGHLDLDVKSKFYKLIVDPVEKNYKVLAIRKQIDEDKEAVKSASANLREVLNNNISKEYNELSVICDKLTQNVIDEAINPKVKLMAIAYANKERYFGTEPEEIISIEREIGESAVSKGIKAYILKEKKQKELEDSRSVGREIPNFTVYSQEGNEIKVYDVLKRNKFVLIDFWASWCGFCRLQFPAMKAAYKKFNKKGFEIFTISVDRDSKKWFKALEEENSPWSNARDTDGISSSIFGVRYLPTNFLVDSNGLVVATTLHDRKLSDKLSELLGE